MITIGPGVVEWVAKRTNEYGNFGAAQGIGWLSGGEIVAGVVFNDFNGPNVCGHIAAVPGCRWLTRKFLAVMFDYPFRQLGVRRITAMVGEGNADSRRWLEHVGFSCEARLAGAHPTGDLLIYRILREECKWLTLPI